MNEKTKTGLGILQAAVLLGVIADLLFRQSSLGLNVFLWFGLLSLAMVAITIRRKRKLLDSQTLALHGALIFFAFSYVWRDSSELKFFSFVAILSILTVQVLPALRIKTHLAGVIHYIVAGAWAAISVAFGPLILLLEDIKWKSLPSTGLSKHLISVAKGLAIALPIFFVFGALFMAADAAFEGLVQNTFQIDAGFLIAHAVTIGIVSWLVAGYLRASVIDVDTVSVDPLLTTKLDEGKKQVPSVTLHISEDLTKEGEENKDVTPKPKEEKQKWDWRKFDNSVMPEFFTLGAIEIGIILGLVNLLFLSFVIVQLPYLFGGMDLVQNTPDFKLAEYARRGFGELIAVAALVLPILLGSHWLLRDDKPLDEKLFRALAGVQIGLLFIIMASAAQRLLLLTGNLGYGLTAERLYPIVVIILLAMVFVWFGVTVLRGMREQFAWGALWIALFMLGTLHVLNPDDFIVRTNIRLMEEGRTFDAYYNANLSSDAVPVLLEALPSLSSSDREEVFQQLHYVNCSQSETDDIRSWNWSRSVAKAKIAGISEVSRRSCPEINDIDY